MKKPTFKPLHPKVVVGIVAHPDDLDFGAAATMAHFANEGADVYYVILTDGGKGTEDREISCEELRDLRRQEQYLAANEIGAKGVFFGDHPDGTLYNSLEVKMEVCRYIRKLKPDVVITFDPTMVYVAERGFINHPDHRAAGQAVLDAVFPLARDHKSFPELLSEGHEPHKTDTVLLVNLGASNYAVDVTTTFEKKVAALRAHKSQIDDMEGTIMRMRERAIEDGAGYGMSMAETFMRIDIQ